ncbi:DUF924 family protein [Sphingomonas sp.]|uniref:DUF924 family protein n=1 Tax=Sphingomonas sp. TaxID=28214 RepID=UPI0025EA4CC8|nr:DUF924 family protein [Sphingomonas sp.]MBV9528267.1 DUF924 domain-containing protein [Sphingomonas sp.]
MAGGDWRADVLKYWFGLPEEKWWRGGDELDEDVRRRFLKVWSRERAFPANSFLTDPLTALAGVLLFDQIPRNMFRGHAEQFATDTLALAIAKGALDKGFDQPLQPQERAFLYMPLEHSERMEDQRRSLLLFTELGDAKMLHFARLHHDIVQRFGRFPHRNAILGRQPRAAEIAAGEVVPW